jgi:hypothetical protein
MRNTYVVYYGWLIGDAFGNPGAAAVEIADAGVPLLVAECFTKEPRLTNMSPQVLALMRNAGTEVYAYVSTRWGRLDLADVEQATAERLVDGVDGIFFDEAPSSLNAVTLRYYRTLSDLVRNQGKSVILNPGVSRCDEALMELADKVMVEHEWRDVAAHSPWTSAFSDRIMGISSNVLDERGKLPMGYRVNRERAIADTHEAWESGVGWHTSTDVHITIPEWFDDYIDAVSAE